MKNLANLTSGKVQLVPLMMQEEYQQKQTFEDAISLKAKQTSFTQDSSPFVFVFAWNSK